MLLILSCSIAALFSQLDAAAFIFVFVTRLSPLSMPPFIFRPPAIAAGCRADISAAAIFTAPFFGWLMILLLFACRRYFSSMPLLFSLRHADAAFTVSILLPMLYSPFRQFDFARLFSMRRDSCREARGVHGDVARVARCATPCVDAARLRLYAACRHGRCAAAHWQCITASAIFDGAMRAKCAAM